MGEVTSLFSCLQLLFMPTTFFCCKFWILLSVIALRLEAVLEPQFRFSWKSRNCFKYFIICVKRPLIGQTMFWLPFLKQIDLLFNLWLREKILFLLLLLMWLSNCSLYCVYWPHPDVLSVEMFLCNFFWLLCIISKLLQIIPK